MLWALLGGGLIGAASVAVLATEGRVAGVSGAISGALSSTTSDRPWRLGFVVGLLAGGVLVSLVAPRAFGVSPAAGNVALLVLGGLLVGVGARAAGGCTSGHGVCGIGRLSSRATIATMLFIVGGAVAVFVVRHVLSGLS